MRRIGVLTSGGDAPGMNAAIRASVRRGYAGLLAGELQPLTRAGVANVIQRGGTLLGTSRCEEFLTVDGRARAAGVLRGAGIEGLVAMVSAEIRRSWERGKRGSIIVVAESGEEGRVFQVAERVSALTGLEPRVCVLGHIQRGGRRRRATASWRVAWGRRRWRH